jgi:hypothetical protein
VCVTLLAALQHRKVLVRLNRGEPYVPPRWSLGLMVAVILVVLGAVMAVYLLVLDRDEPRSARSALMARVGAGAGGLIGGSTP